jgi:hypothetical protein
MDVERHATGIAEAVLASRRHDQRLACRDDNALVIHPHFALALAHRQHFLDRMGMCRRAETRRHPLFEDA